MSDEDIIELWKQGWNIDEIAHNFPSVKFREGKEPSWQMYNRVETVILKYQNGNIEDEEIVQKLKEIMIKMDEFSNKYDCRIKVETIEAREIPNDRKRCIYDLKVIKE